MVVMMSVMRLLEDQGVLRRVAWIIFPLLVFFGLPGLGIFAVLQILTISFAAPTSTLRIMDQDPSIPERRVAATFAAVLTMSQANATFPLTVIGLNLPVTILTSFLGGLLAGFLTYRFFGKNLGNDSVPVGRIVAAGVSGGKEGIVQTLMRGGEEGLLSRKFPLPHVCGQP
jgi:hypothetical protein